MLRGKGRVDSKLKYACIYMADLRVIPGYDVFLEDRHISFREALLGPLPVIIVVVKFAPLTVVRLIFN